MIHHVKIFGNGYDLDAEAVEVGNRLGSVGDGAEQPVETGDDDYGMTSTGLCKQALPRRPAPQGLPSRDAWVLVNGGQVETLHLTVGPHPLALSLEAEATLGLFFATGANVTECATHWRILLSLGSE